MRQDHIERIVVKMSSDGRTLYQAQQPVCRPGVQSPHCRHQPFRRIHRIGLVASVAAHNSVVSVPSSDGLATRVEPTYATSPSAAAAAAAAAASSYPPDPSTDRRPVSSPAFRRLVSGSLDAGQHGTTGQDAGAAAAVPAADAAADNDICWSPAQR